LGGIRKKKKRKKKKQWREPGSKKYSEKKMRDKGLQER